MHDQFAEIRARFAQIAAALARGGGEGKHRQGGPKPGNYRRQLQARRKRERDARRHARLRAKRRKHRMKGMR